MKIGCLNGSYLSKTAIFHFHDYGRKSKPLKGSSNSLVSNLVASPLLLGSDHCWMDVQLEPTMGIPVYRSTIATRAEGYTTKRKSIICTIIWVVPPPSKSHHQDQDYYIFSKGSLYTINLHLPQLLGGGTTQTIIVNSFHLLSGIHICARGLEKLPILGIVILPEK